MMSTRTLGFGTILWKADRLPRVIKESIRGEESGRVFSVECKWTIFQRRFLQFQSTSVGNLFVPGLVHSLRWNMGAQMGISQPRARFGSKHSSVLTSLSQTSYLLKVKGKGNKSRNSSLRHVSEIKRGLLESREQSAPFFDDVVKVASLPSPFVGGAAQSTCQFKNVTNTLESSGELHGTITATRTAQRMSSAHPVPFIPSGVELVSRAT